ncbi:hypothetical protein RF11_15198 [Thelohanellus kitauei]|uniref:Uncharacterized protein n=1 Tax=Thelohanellus kitauei TaxID=669202 RepID=A0A0C2J4E7_THEKT|nr:hypothetical protein RF11_15198 [Thelohanellus kitauei]
MKLLSFAILTVVLITTLATVAAATFRLVFPFTFCNNWEKLPLSYLMIGVGGAVVIMILLGYVGVALNSKPLGYVFITVYVITVIGSIVAIVFGVLIYKDIATAIDTCFKDNERVDQRLEDPFIKWFQPTFKCCSVPKTTNGVTNTLPQSCCIHPGDDCNVHFADDCSEKFIIVLYTQAGVFMAGIVFWVLLLPITIGDMIRKRDE